MNTRQTLIAGVAIAVTSLFGPTALARSLNLHFAPGNYFESCNAGGCVGGDLPSSDAKVIHVPLDDSPEAQVRIRKWEAYCRPEPHADKYNVIRLTYAHEGCEFGRSE